MNAETEFALGVAGAEAAMGITVTFAAPEGSAAFEGLPNGVRSAVLPGEDIGRSPSDLLAAGRWISARTRETGLVHSSRSAAHVAAGIARSPDSRLVHLRGGAARPSGGILNRCLYRRRTDAVIVSSRRIETWVRERLGLAADRLFLLYLPVDIGRFTTEGGGTGLPAGAGIREEFGIGVDAPLVVNVARLAPVKGHPVLLDAWAAVVREHPEAVLLLVGEPWSGQPEGLRGQAARLGVLSCVRFAGRRSDVPALLAAASVCVSSSVGSEENSRAVSEYMAAGRPVVATRVGVIPELVADGESGLLVPPSDASGLASAVSGLLADHARATRMGLAARDRARELFSRQAFESGLAAVLTSVGIGSSGRSADATFDPPSRPVRADRRR